MVKLCSSIALCMILACCSGTRPASLGVRAGRLAPCPGSPNCVSTQAEDERHFIDPIRYTRGKAQARKSLMQVIEAMPGARLITDDGNYLHVEFSSRIFRFTDDVEFFFDDTERLIHFRSASRLGYSDLGVNRRRMEDIRRLFKEKSGQ